MSDAPLELRLRALVDAYRQSIAERRDLHARIEELQRQIADFQDERQGLRAQIDALDAGRFKLKKLQEERRTLRRKLERAVARLDSLEQEL